MVGCIFLSDLRCMIAAWWALTTSKCIGTFPLVCMLMYVKSTLDSFSVAMKSKRSPYETLHGTHLHDLIVSII
jgi:hypothetical protein